MDATVIPFARRKSDKALVDTTEVPGGKACGCICPSCRSPLVARKGVNMRAAGQPLLNAEGFSLPVVDAYSTSKSAIRGREQQLIDYYGGARSVGGTTRNMINGISDRNPVRDFYMDAADTEFGRLPDNSPAR